MQNVTVLGGGSFATALAQLCARCGQQVVMVTRSQARADHINHHHQNPDYLSHYTLSWKLRATSDLGKAMATADWLIIATPSHAVRDGMEKLAEVVGENTFPIVLACKGLETATLMTMAEVVVDVLGDPWHDRVMALSGPSFAEELMQEQPTAVVLASSPVSQAIADAETIRTILFSDSFRAYGSTDMIGVEMGGALKNVMAIAAGAVTGMGLGSNTRAALVTRGVAEMNRLAVAKGANPLTLAGLAGVGDMVLTCTGGLSRNRAVGQALGEGLTLEEAIDKVRQVAEGIKTTASAHLLAKKLGVDAPIIDGVYEVLYGGQPVRAALLNLVRRAPGSELD